MNNDAKNKSNIKVSFYSGIISHIYAHMCSSFADFNGLLLGKTKLVVNTKANDSHSASEEKTLCLSVDNVIFIYDRNYLKEKFEKLIDKVMKKYPDSVIIGLFTARSFSYPTISLKEQESYLKAITFFKSKFKYPYTLLFATFSHNVADETNEVKTTNFYSKLFAYNEDNSNFISLPYEIVNMKESSYTATTNPIADKTNFVCDTTPVENLISKLKSNLTETVNEIETKQQKVLKDLKMQLKLEIEENEKLLEKLKSYAT